MPLPERPCLRRFLHVVEDAQDPRFVYLVDRLPWGSGPLRLTLQEFGWLRLFNGGHTLPDLQALATRQAGGRLIPRARLARLVEVLDDALFLEGPRFQARASGPVREPSCLGCYEADPKALCAQLTDLFAGPNGPGLPRPPQPDGRLRALLLPHIDYARGGATFAWGFKELYERTDAALFVILGTSHYSPHRYTLTTKGFRTPLGIVPTDRDYVDRLTTHYGDGLFDDEIAHLPEHAIELEIVFLQYLYASARRVRVVPLLVGPFQDCIEAGDTPQRQPDIGRMIDALRRVEAETREPLCYLISGDLAHVGPKFGDPHPVSASFLHASRSRDQAILNAAAAVDPERYFQLIAGEGDCRRICGLPPTYTTLAAAIPRAGRVLHYDQFVHPEGYESVSFASMVFER